MRVRWALVGLLVCSGTTVPGHAQRALSGSSAAPALRGGATLTRLEPQALPPPLLTLRPQPELKRLAEEVAAVLELRTGQRVEVGSPPPPGLLEAVPTGHVALARQQKAVLLVLGAPGGRSFDATVRLTDEAGVGSAADARAVALAAEALRDAAADTARTADPIAAAEPTPRPAIEPEADAPPPDEPVAPPAPVHVAVDPYAVPRAPAPALAISEPAHARDEGDASLSTAGKGLFGGDIEPLIYARVYGGASPSSSGPMAGLGAGLGLCVQRNCFFLAGELPANTGSPVAEHIDVRYRYPTFISGFYARPFSFGAFTPGASIGFLTRLGHFQADMGYKDTGVDTDLGARGSVELAWEMVSGLDLMTEAGVDVTLDRQRLGTTELVRNRGDRWSPWGQLALRYRL